MKDSDPEIGETNKMSPTIAPAYCLERVSRLRCREEGRGTQVEQSSLPELRGWSWESREARAGIYGVEYWREESYVERELWCLQSLPPWGFDWSEETTEDGERTAWKAERPNTGSPYDPGTSSCSHRPECKTSSSMPHQVVYSEKFCLNSGEYLALD